MSVCPNHTSSLGYQDAVGGNNRLPNGSICLCNHGYYAHHGFEMVAEFKSDEWKNDSDDYLTYIYRKSFLIAELKLQRDKARKSFGFFSFCLEIMSNFEV